MKAIMDKDGLTYLAHRNNNDTISIFNDVADEDGYRDFYGVFLVDEDNILYDFILERKVRVGILIKGE